MEEKKIIPLTVKRIRFFFFVLLLIDLLEFVRRLSKQNVQTTEGRTMMNQMKINGKEKRKEKSNEINVNTLCTKLPEYSMCSLPNRQCKYAPGCLNQNQLNWFSHEYYYFKIPKNSEQKEKRKKKIGKKREEIEKEREKKNETFGIDIQLVLIGIHSFYFFSFSFSLNFIFDDLCMIWMQHLNIYLIRYVNCV